ncbi:CHAT domain-containing protein [Spirulina subsalsa FACHB-351]|uniref:CHAT domain-containing protein n=1 Tax=Spirulina subsalsa FACHB-351 TaxID=234711 RepID=A0ABT3LAT0_9CYAN|nr:CHAT domain-containing protein [Spirulina subsalsa]MCW6038217.1 CHAT domain-containing protein [Spirulina subsalsa FACHB-351]
MKTQRLNFRLVIVAVLSCCLCFLTPSLSMAQGGGFALIEQGLVAYPQNPAAAIALWRQALPQGTRNTQALIYHYLSLGYQELGRWQEAEEALREGFRRLPGGEAGENLAVEARLLNTQGRFYWLTGRPQQALGAWQRATRAYERVEDREGVIGSLINQSQGLLFLGFPLEAKGVLERVEGALEGLPEGDLKEQGRQSLGRVWRQVGDLRRSEAILKQGRSSGSGLELGNTRRVLWQRAIAFQEEPDVESALSAYQEAFQRAITPLEQVQAQLNGLSLQIAAQRWREAAEVQASLAPLLAQLPPNHFSLETQLNFAQSLICLQEELNRVPGVPGCPAVPPVQSTPTGAIIGQQLAQGVQTARELGDLRLESAALGQLGELYERNQQYSEAERLTQQALRIAEDRQALDLRYRWEWQLGRLAERQDNPEGAIALYKIALKTLDQVRSTLLPLDPNIQFDFRDNIEPIYRRLAELLLEEKPGEENIKEALETIDQLQLVELENFLRCRILPLVPITRNLAYLDDQTALIYPILFEHRIAIIVKFPHQPFKAYWVDESRDEIENEAWDFVDLLINQGESEKIYELGNSFYKKLIKPWESELKNYPALKHLVFILDGALRNIPISALWDEKDQKYLVEKPYSLSILPNLNVFDLQRVAQTKLNLLLLGVSEERTIEDENFSALENVERELEEIGAIFPAKTLLNADFSQQVLEQLLENESFSAIHIASHGQFSSNLENTFVMTYHELLRINTLQRLIRTNFERRLTPLEILSLSACETATGDNRATLGLAGIAVRSGAKTTLASLWRVNDASTQVLMTEFYRQLQNPIMTKAEALQLAQQELMKDVQYNSPFHWAAYILVGNWY